MNASMAAINNLVTCPKDFNSGDAVQPDDGLADDDSWVENISPSEEDLNDFDISESNEEADHEDKLRGFNGSSIDFTLHTIVEESCEESEVDHSDYDANESKEKNIDEKTGTSPSCLEKYFFFGLGNGERSSTLEDSSSEIFSDCSDNGDIAGVNDVSLKDGKSDIELSTSRLEKYFLSGFLGFSAETKSDGSVGSDSEGQPSPSQRKKKFVRARGTPRSNNSSLDNLLVESADTTQEQFVEKLDSSESETESCSETGAVNEKLDSIDSLKRKKNYRKRELLEQKFHMEPSKSTLQNVTYPKYNPNTSEEDHFKLIKSIGLTSKTMPSLPSNTLLARKDSFSNWSSDEETNLMMSKMRHFFKTLIAVTAQNYTQSNNFSSYSEKYFNQSSPSIKSKAFKFSYFENELVRLMKTVPGINNQQVREIVEYFSSEDTWSDSNDSSDCNMSNIDTANKSSKKNLDCSKEEKDNLNASNDEGLVNPRILNTETVLVCTNLLESLMISNSKKTSDDMITNDKWLNDQSYAEKSPQLLAKVMQHIGRKLVALMHDVSIGTDSAPQHTQKHLLRKDSTNSDENSTKFLIDHLDFIPAHSSEWGNLPRSKSHDLLLGSNNRSWHFNSNNTVNENAGEVSDYDRFSWRGSFESALLAPGDSRSKLVTVDRDNCSLKSELSIPKRRSVDNLTYSVVQNGEQLDRVQSCGSIGVEKQSNSEAEVWLSPLFDTKNKIPLDLSSRVDIEDIHCTNSLPRLQSLQYSPNISDKSKSDTNVIQSNVKSARYRSPTTQPSALSSTIAKRNTLQLSEYCPLNNLQRSITSSTSLDDFSISEFSSNINKSPGMQRNQFYRRNNNNFGMRCDSLTSVYSDVFENQYGIVRVKGEIMFGMQYNYKISALEIHIVKCKDLAAVDTKRCKSDPYVKVYLLPDKSKNGKRKTKVKKHTLNPVFDEIVRFYVSISNLKTRSIWVTVWHSDMFGRNEFLGEVTINLQGRVFDNPQSQWYTLQEKNRKLEDETTSRGDIVVGLKFVTLGNSKTALSDSSLIKRGSLRPYVKGQLHVLIKEAKNLCSPRSSGTCDTFCKSYLLPNRTRTSKQKTAVRKKTLNPVWNSTFVYDGVSLQDLSERALELTVWDHDRLISNQLLGGVRFSLGTGKHYGSDANWMHATGKELFLWQEMINRPNFWVEGSVSLRPNLDVKREFSKDSKIK